MKSSQRAVVKNMRTVILLGVYLFAGCRMPPSQKEAQSLSVRVTQNTANTEALMARQRTAQEELTNALITVCEELSSLKTTVAIYESKLEDVTTRLEELQKDLATRDTETTEKMEAVVLAQTTLGERLDAQDEKISTESKALAEKQEAQETITTNLQTLCEQLAKKVVALLAQLKETQEQLTQLGTTVEGIKGPATLVEVPEGPTTAVTQ